MKSCFSQSRIPILFCLMLTLLLLLSAPAYGTEYDLEAYEEQVSKILDEDLITDMSDEQLALYIHDQLILRYRYDLEGSFPETSHSAYGLLVNGAAVCDGYAEAYLDLMTRVGVPCVIVQSSVMNHAWNLVQIDGYWYHVDVTWDDPARKHEDVQGYVLHKYFMMSDVKAKETGHRSWEKKHECTNTKYDTGAYWEGVESQFCFLNANISYHLEYTTGGPNQQGIINPIVAQIYCLEHTTGTETLIFSKERNLPVVDGIYSAVEGISLWDGVLYIGDNAQLFAVCPVTGDSWAVYTHDRSAVKSGSQAIHGAYVRNGIAYITTRDMFEIRDNYVVTLAPSGHKITIVRRIPTCQVRGYTQIRCSCDETINLAEHPALEHNEEKTVAKAPTYDQPGVMEIICVWCGATRQETIPSLKETGCKFDDVFEERFYYQSVIWACANGITSGTSNTQFSPEKTCTRAEVVTFLWRASGCPESGKTSSVFDDVKSGAFYEKAVAWAVEEGITNGTTDTTFSPGEPCTRGQVATFLWRTAGKPTPPQNSLFIDTDPASFYYPAVQWAVSEDITKGTSANTFSPSNPCSRGQIVTFLYRYMN